MPYYLLILALAGMPRLPIAFRKIMRPLCSLRLIPMLVLALLVFLRAGDAWSLEITGLRLGPHPDKTRVVIDLDRPTPFRSFMLADPVRLVIDMPHFNWRVGHIMRPAGTPVTDIRQGALQPGYARIVIDLVAPSLIQSAFLIPRRDGQPDRLVIDFTGASPEQFNRHRSIIHGDLQLEHTPPAPQGVSAPPAGTADAAPIPPRKPQPQNQTQRQAFDAPPPSRMRKHIVVLDPGHGGNDPGAVGANRLLEKNITLAMAHDLKKALEATGRYTVHLTRERDIFIRLSQRVAIARQKNADLFISLHADSIDKSGVRGASIYTLSEKASDAEAEKLAARENLADSIAGLDLHDEDADVADILVDLTMRDTMNQSKFFANKTIGQLKNNGIKVLQNSHRFAGFAVLKAPDVPSVLIELGYMSNSQESAMLSRPEYRARIASALVASIDGYFSTVSR